VAEEYSLELQRLLPASRAAVFRAMTEPDQLARWWGPHGFSCPEVDFEPRVGGSYRIAMQPPEGELFHLEGEFLEVEAPTRLSFSFRWDPPDPDDQETVASLALAERGAQTEVTLVQRPFATEARRELHEQGWSDGFERLRELLS
jgi:uncharacterized protein YndB with AHSA1/START domain